MKIHSCIQGSEEWSRLRLGVPTASNFHKIITPRSGKPSSQSDGYMYDLLAEMSLGHPIETVKTEWMHRGNEMEAKAVDYYELQTDQETTPVGFITNDTGTIGCSPDRIVSPELLLECKCPSPGVQMAYVLGKSGVEDEYRVQLQGQLYVTGCKAVDIISYHPHLPHAIVRVERDEEFIKLLDAELRKFVAKLAEKREELDRRGLLAKPEENERSDDSSFLSRQDEDMIVDSLKMQGVL